MRIATKLSIATALCGLVTVAALATATPASGPAPQDQPQWYSVEVLVFRYTGPDAAQGVVWPRKVPTPSLAHAIYPATGQDQHYLPMATPSDVMDQARQRLAATAGYAPVVEAGWLQPGLDTDQARRVSLEPLPAAATTPGATPASAPGATPAVTVTPAASVAAPAVQLGGTATFVVSANKPYVKLDLRLCEPAPPGIELQAPSVATSPATALAAMTSMSAATLAPAPVTATPAATSPAAAGPSLQCFALKESRQVTPGQLEYFDTAAFGALALVNPVKTPAAAATRLPAARKHG